MGVGLGRVGLGVKITVYAKWNEVKELSRVKAGCTEDCFKYFSCYPLSVRVVANC